MLNISRARVYDTTQWASLLSADGNKKNSDRFHFHAPAPGMEQPSSRNGQQMSINRPSVGA